MPQDPNFFELFERLGSITTTLRDVSQQISEMRGQQEARHDENRKGIADNIKKLSDFKHEHANQAQKAEIRLGRIESEAKQLKNELRELQKPVSEIIAIRSKIGIGFAAILSISGAIWFFMQPIWTFIYEHWIFKIMNGGSHS